MMSTLITTPVAKFSIQHLAKHFGERGFPQDAWTRMYSKSYPNHRVELYGRKGRGVDLIFATGPVDLKPRIWTHCPVPLGMDIEGVQERFEERARSVLSDYEEPTNLDPDPLYLDGRYKDISVRAAWMMYVDLAIEHYLSTVYH